ncbi:hypothetical protein F5Y15DRAFT_55497 [Xylariaceae sp. FL0016]|nr:hypothetical protein F5Y15DRAFT_55497 [Xylariaceae sp. FL0016]
MAGLWDEEDFGKLADRVLWPFFAITAAIVALRVMCRLHYGRQGRAGLGLDDWITLFCLAVSLAVSVLITIGSQKGLGKHADTLSPEQKIIALKYNTIINSILIWQFSLPKFAIIAILQRILNYGRKTSILFWGLGLSSQACILASSIWWFEQCDPVELGWNKNLKGWCADISILANLGYFTSAYSAFLDLFFAIYPIPFIMSLHMPLKSRIAVSTALSLSSLACIASIIKLSIFGQVFAIMPTDPTWPLPYLDILGMTEGYVLIICASLPTLGPLFRSARGKLTSSGDSAHNSRQAIGSMPQKSWAQSRERRLTDPEQGLGRDSNLDDVPLVPSKKMQVYSGKIPGIQKTVDFTIVSEPASAAPPPAYVRQ